MKSLSVNLVAILVIGLAIFGHPEVWGADWKLYSISPVPGLPPEKAKFYHYYDWDSINWSSGIVKVWTKFSSLEEELIKKVKQGFEQYQLPKETILEVIVLCEMNCKEKKYRQLSGTTYGGKGNILYSHPESLKWEYIVPDTIPDALYETVCKAAEQENRSSMSMGTSWPITLGYIVTNYHIIEGHKKITLILVDGKKIPATVYLGDKINDIVLLKVADPRDLPPALPIAISKPGMGTKVFTIGYPHPDILGANPKLTDGLISSLTGLQNDPRTYQITIPLHAGNSGGPLLNLNGEVVGIVTSKLDAIRVFTWTGDLPQNVSYAVKISYLKALIDSMTAKTYPINELSRESADLERLAKRLQKSVMIVLAE
jgi:S1-C subfamily serine protease